MTNRRVQKRITGIILAGFILAAFPVRQAEAFSDQVVQKGATGDDVVELQSRLQYNGFYEGTIDGVFGWGTYWSVRNYQDEFGLEVDGLVGPDMKAMLEKSTKYNEAFVKKALEEGRDFTHYGGTPDNIEKGPKGSADGGKKQNQPQKKEENGGPQQNQRGSQRNGQTGKDRNNQKGEGNKNGGSVDENQSNQANIQKAMNVPEGYSENEIQIMSNAVYGEARGEPYVGQVAVAAVIINRMESPAFPNTASGVIFEPRAFTAVADGQIYMEPNEEARKAVLDAINGQDPSGGAIYYYNPVTATSDWIFSRETIKTIGKHKFSK
ncbi:spore cortex-lytic enzyme [Salibacterium halotolerans]|uniref:Spore cortex-lytic enzyme n=1 Tax=Salibacterium halotolerans TaxID=1884432 RepID=A0A1I5Q3B9_9BACI|nr:spore cortex-lytic enzyme [Salibacterium halotolerans]SFP40725.1 N-acetylmuramoyl-L-alanine amidase [Salibacterium halotolerans]